MKFSAKNVEDIKIETRDYIFKTYESIINTNTEAKLEKLNSFIPESYSIEFIEEDDITSAMEDILKRVTNTFMNGIFIDENIKLIEDRIKKTKSRWVNKDLSSKGLLSEEMNIIKQMYSFLNKDEDKFFKIFNVKNPEEYRDKQEDAFLLWVSDNSLPLGEYKYIQTKKYWQILSALKNDIELNLSRGLKVVINSNKVPSYEVPKELTQYPIDISSSKITVDAEALERIKNSGLIYVDLDVYKFGDITFKSRYEVAMFKEHTLMNTIKRLGELDQRIIGYLLSVRDEEFFKTREINTTTGDIARSISKTINGNVYSTIRESLFKLQYLTITAVTSELRGFSLKIIDNVDIIDVGGKDNIRVLFNQDVVEQVANNKTIVMYKEAIDSFNSTMSLPIILKLQIERIKAFNENKKVMRVSYNYFKNFIFLVDKKKSRNIRKIEKALDEIIKSGKTLKSYSRINSDFVFEFHDITESEKKDLFINFSAETTSSICFSDDFDIDKQLSIMD